MRKVKGYDIFVLACKGSLLIVELKNASNLNQVPFRASINSESGQGQREFQVLNKLENLFNSYIFEVAIINDLLIPLALGQKEDYLKIV